jgi:4-carboxymuconolactone decarboxylase
MSQLEEGRAILADIFGPKILETRKASRNAFNADLQDYTDEICWGRIWSRPGIDRKTRSIMNIAMLIALNRTPQLRSHIDGALANGCTVEELREILLHTAVYAGLPAAITAFGVAEEVLKEKGLLG